MDTSLGARVRAARTMKGLSLRALAGRLGVSAATLSQIENGHTGLSVDRLQRLAETLELTVAEILELTPTAPVAVPPALVSPPTEWRRYGPLPFDPVLHAALDEFLAIGYHGATVRGIAARAGLSVAGLYHYYASKQRMLVSILDHTMSDLLARAEAARAEGKDAVERFSLLVENLTLYHTHRRELGFVGASEMRSFEAANRQRIAEMRVAQQRMVDFEVEEAVRQGHFRTEHPHEAARAVVTMCTALPTWWRPDGPLSPEQMAALYVSFALDLMRRPA